MPDKKLFYHNGKKVDIKLLTSDLVESRWTICHLKNFMTKKHFILFRLVAAVFKILSTEVLGYDIKIVGHENDSSSGFTEEDFEDDSITTLLDTEERLRETFSSLSSCNTKL